LALGTSITAYAETCTYGKVDDSIMISNVPLQTTKKKPQGPCFGVIEDVPDTPVKSDKKATTPANFPKVDAATQQQRDGSRRQILQDEMKTELKALDQAQVNNKTDDIMLHAQNVKMLEKELSSLK
jgi:hypothetical protein